MTQRRILAGVLALLLLVSLAFCAAYVTENTQHECTGEHCFVCACLRQCARLLQSARELIWLCPLVLGLWLVVGMAATVFSYVSDTTPVSLYIRLND